MSGESGHPLLAAVYDPATAAFERWALREHREYLVRDLKGSVLDLGAGTGATFPYLADCEGVTVEAIEPDPHMRRRATAKATDVGLDVEIHDARAEALPFSDGAFDAVVASMVFCTIPDVETALSEVARVLKPGGEVRFLEHVHADGWRGRVQTLSAPLWRRVAGGCHLDRRSGSTLAAADDFDVVEIERLDLGVTPVWPFVRGRLRRRA
jgi:ubiquinone/menaquinone biosynthesis C-methylase UbiE